MAQHPLINVFFLGGVGYQQEIGEKISVGISFKSYYGFLPDHDQSFDTPTHIEFFDHPTIYTDAFTQINFFRDISWYELSYASRYYFHASRDDGYYVQSSIGYYHLRSIFDVISINYDYNPVGSYSDVSVGKIEQVNTFIPISLGLGTRGYVETGALNDLSADFEIGVKYITGDTRPMVENNFFRQHGEIIDVKKLSFYCSLSFGLMF